MDISLTSGMRSTLLSIQEADSATRRTAQRLSSGNKVNSPLDDPTNFFASSALKNAAADIEQLQDAIGEGVRVINAATKGLEGVAAVLETMKGLVEDAAATSDPARTAALAKSFDESYAQLNSIVRDSGYAGMNLISNNSGDPLAVTSDDLTVALNAAGTADYQVRGKFMGSGYVLREVAGGTAAWVPDERGEVLGGYGTPGASVGNLSDISLIVRFDPQVNSSGDVDHDGVVEAGEGTEIDFQLTNNSAATATGISFCNAATSRPWSFFSNTSAILGDVAAGSSVRTDTGTDLDLNFPHGTNGQEFTISLDVTSDGVTKALTFGPLKVGSLTNGQTFQAQAASTVQNMTAQAVQINAVDYLNGTFNVNIPGVGAKVLQAEKQGLQLLHSWAYDGFRTAAGIGAARSDLAHALNTVRSYAKEIGASSMILTVRSEFNATLAGTFVTGAENLTLADMNEEAANALMLQTRRELAVTALAITGEDAKDVLKLLE